MEQQTLEVMVRSQTGKGPARRTRMAGNLPGVLYGSGQTPTPITLNPKLVLGLLLQEGGRNRVLTLKGTGVDGKAVIVKDYQIDPLSRALVHVDLMEIDLTKKIQVTIKLTYTGKAAGVADGGVMNIIERQISVKCLPNQIPGHIDVDVTALTIGDSIHLNDIVLPTGVERLPNINPTLVTVVPPAKDEELAPSLAPSAEPEVITAKKAEGEEGEEGAAPGKEGAPAKGGAAPAKGGAAPAAAGKKEDKKK